MPVISVNPVPIFELLLIDGEFFITFSETAGKMQSISLTITRNGGRVVFIKCRETASGADDSRDAAGEIVVPIQQSIPNDALLSEEQLRQAQAMKNATGQPVDEALVNLGFCTPESALEALARQAGVPVVQIIERDLDPRVIAMIPTALAFRHQVLPLSATATTLRVAIADPFNTAAADDLRLVTGRDIELVFAPPQDIRRFVEEYYTRRMIADTTEDDVQVLEEGER